MGLFDRWRKKKSPASPPSSSKEIASGALERQGHVTASVPDPSSSTEAEPRSTAEQEYATVPDGHHVTMYRGTPEPYQTRAPGGAWIANPGLGGDEQVTELNALLREVEAALAGPPGEVLLSMGAVRLSDLFAPNDPEIERCPGLLLWIFHRDSLAGWVEEPKRLQSLLQQLYRLGAQPERQITQFAFLMEDSWGNARLVAHLLEGLGIRVRRPESHGRVLAEVRRPEGVVIAALLGAPYLPEGTTVDPYPLTVNREKALAEGRGDRERLAHLEEQERHYLAQLLVRMGSEGEVQPIARAPRLCRLLQKTAQAQDDEAWRQLCEELIGREIPLLLMANSSGGVAARAWPGLGNALPAYPDHCSLMWAAEDLGMSTKGLGMALMHPRELFAWAADISVGVAMNVYLDRKTPRYVLFHESTIRALLEGRVPPLRRETVA